jgi:hypothetical protein
MADHEDKEREGVKKPPGDFLSEDLREETARFINEVKRQIQSRTQRKEEPKLGPPRRRGTE